MLQDHPNGLDGDKPCYEMPVSVEPSTPVQLTGAKTAKGAKLNGRASDNRNQKVVSPIVIEDQEPLQQPFEAPQLCTVTNDAKRAEVNEIRAQIIRRASLCQEADCSCEADTNTGSCVHCPLCQRWSLSVSVRLDGSLSIICMATNDKYGQRHQGCGKDEVLKVLTAKGLWGDALEAQIEALRQETVLGENVS
jgi:hypothetical protein